MTFAETFGAIGKIIDEVLDWHLNLPWYVLIPVIIIYFVAFWALNKYIMPK
jgi:hypothetical protein